VVVGEVDVVVAMRDAGRYAHSADSGFGDRLAVAGIEYEIRGKGIHTQQASFDFERIRFRKGYRDQVHSTKQARVVYKPWKLFEEQRVSGSRVLSYYNITNAPADQDRIRELAPEDRARCWDTTSIPDGVYEITVTAWDFKGNRASARDEVVVRNRR